MSKKIFRIFGLILILLISGCISTKNTIYINEIMSKNSGYIYDLEGDSSDWIELYNYGTTDINIKDFSIFSNGKNSPSHIFKKHIIKGGQTLLLWCSGKTENTYNTEIHIPFKISSSGEKIILKDSEDILIDQFDIPKLKKNEVYGRTGDNFESIGILTDPTPGESNWSEIIVDENPTSIPKVSRSSGFYKTEFELSITAGPGESIFYTLDGSEPTPLSTLYDSPINIKDLSDTSDRLSQITGTSESFRYPNKNSFKGTVVRAVSYYKGRPISPINTNTYFITTLGNKKYSIPTISISTNKENLFDYDTGIYMLGKNNDNWKKSNHNSKIQGDNPANFNQRGKGWAIPVNIEYFNDNNSLSINAAMRILGGWSRANPIKSIRLDFENPIDNIIFEDLNILDLDSVVLRTSGNDWESTLFRDSLMTGLVSDLLEIQDSVPAVVFINGEYWGIHNIRERMNPEYFESHFNIPKKNISVLENQGLLAEGNQDGEKHYEKILDYLKNNDMTDSTNYEYISSKIDIQNFITYFAVQIFYGNGDWPGNNIRFWQDSQNDTKWRWILYDTDFGFGLYDWNGGVNNNTFKVVMEPNGEEWPNPPWSTFIFRTLMNNEKFRNSYLNTFCDLANSLLSKELVDKEIKKMTNVYANEIQEHMNRWNSSGGTKRSWMRLVSVLNDFIARRDKIIKRYTSSHLKLGGVFNLKIGEFHGGTLSVNSLKNIEKNWFGSYFKGIPLDIVAKPDYGFKFVGWQEYNSLESNISVKLDKDLLLTPIFQKK